VTFALGMNAPDSSEMVPFNDPGGAWANSHAPEITRKRKRKRGTRVDTLPV
jgi:hypothetical protein